MRGAAGARSSATGTVRVARLELRAGWPGLLLAPLLAAGLVAAVAASISGLYPDLASRQRYAATFGPSLVAQAFNGRGYGLSTLGGITAYEVGFMGLLLFPLLGLHTGLRHTRYQEELGRTELVTAGCVGRLAPLAAAVLLLKTVSGLVWLLSATGAVLVGLEPVGSAWYAAGVALCVFFFGCVGLLLGQVSQYTRTGYMLGLVAVTATFLVRAVVDGMGWGVVWVSPLGWFSEVRPFAEPRWWPLLAYTVGGLGLLLLAAHVAGHRDLGAGVIAPRPGPARASQSLRTSLGLAWRVNRAGALALGLLAGVWAAALGLLSNQVTELVEANPSLLAALGLKRGSDLVAELVVVIVAAAALALVVQGGARLGAEESTGRLGWLLATRASRPRLWLSWWGVVTGLALGVLQLGCLVLGLSTWAATGDRSAFEAMVAAGVGYTVPVLFVAALVSCLAAAGTRWAVVGWVVVGWVLVVGFLSEALRLREWARDLSPLHLVGVLPRQTVSVTMTCALAAAGTLLVLGAFIRFCRRDLRAG